MLFETIQRIWSIKVWSVVTQNSICSYSNSMNISFLSFSFPPISFFFFFVVFETCNRQHIWFVVYLAVVWSSVHRFWIFNFNIRSIFPRTFVWIMNRDNAVRLILHAITNRNILFICFFFFPLPDMNEFTSKQIKFEIIERKLHGRSKLFAVSNSSLLLWQFATVFSPHFPFCISFFLSFRSLFFFFVFRFAVFRTNAFSDFIASSLVSCEFCYVLYIC